MMKRMIRNVVDNASRYATEKLCFDSHYDGDEAVVIVADDGDGIDVSQSERFFERFIRSDPHGAPLRRHRLGPGHRRRDRPATRGSVHFIECAQGTTIELRVRRDGRSSA